MARKARLMSKTILRQRIRELRKSLQDLEKAIRTDDWEDAEDILVYLRGDTELIAEGVEQRRGSTS